MSKYSILVVDDDAGLREALAELFSLYDEFDLRAAGSAASGLLQAKNGTDLVIMDVGLEDMDGREAVRLLRRSGLRMPVIMLTGHASDADAILGLECGANDYVTKPFRFPVLLARMRALLRRHPSGEDATLAIGPYSFRPTARLLVDANGRTIRLTETETSVLRHLHRAGPQPVSREQLLQEVWGYDPGVDTHTLETHIHRLRRKVERDAAAPAILLTQAGGYRLGA